MFFSKKIQVLTFLVTFCVKTKSNVRIYFGSATSLPTVAPRNDNVVRWLLATGCRAGRSHRKSESMTPSPYFGGLSIKKGGIQIFSRRV